jgi:hypothetical protein
MDILLLLLWMILLIVLLTVPIALGYLIYCWLKKKGYGRLANYIFSALAIFIVYNIYTAIYPTDSFYKDEFEYCFKMKFPKSGEIIAKDASYPDLHGDYCMAFVSELSEKDYKDLEDHFKRNNRYVTNDSFETGSEQLEIVTASLKKISPKITYYKCQPDSSLYVSVSFYEGNKILVHKARW